MKLLCITEPSTHPSFDTTVELYARCAADSNISLFHLPARQVTEPADSNASEVLVASVSEIPTYDAFLQLNEHATTRYDLGDFDLVFCRTDKPYPDRFLETLCSFEAHAPFVNSPTGILQHIDTAFQLKVTGEFIPDWIWTRDMKETQEFFEQWGCIVAKRANSYGGKGVYKLSQAEGQFLRDNVVEGPRAFDTLESLLQDLFETDSQPFLFVRFLKNGVAGDKRVLVVDGEIYGGYVRRSKTDHWVHNITAGGGYHSSEVGERERSTIAATVPAYQAIGVYTLGYDFLTDDDGQWRLSEINAGNIGGYGRLAELNGTDEFARLLTWLKSRSRS